MSSGSWTRIRQRAGTKLETMRRLSWGERLLLLEAACLVSAAGLSLKLCSVKTLCAVMGRSGRLAKPTPSVGAQALARGRHVARLVDMASRHTPLPNTCLHRSLALWWLLGRRGIECRLSLGTRRHDGKFEAHAWVEYDGVVIAGEDGEGAPYVRLPWNPLQDEV